MIQHTHRTTLPGGGQVEVIVTEGADSIRVHTRRPPLKARADIDAFVEWVRPILLWCEYAGREVVQTVEHPGSGLATPAGAIDIGPGPGAPADRSAAAATTSAAGGKRQAEGRQYPCAPPPVPEPAPAGPARPLLVREHRVDDYRVEFSVARPDYFGPFRLEVAWSPDMPRIMTGAQRRAYRRARDAFIAEAAEALGLEGGVSVVVEV